MEKKLELRFDIKGVHLICGTCVISLSSEPQPLTYAEGVQQVFLGTFWIIYEASDKSEAGVRWQDPSDFKTTIRIPFNNSEYRYIHYGSAEVVPISSAYKAAS